MRQKVVVLGGAGAMGRITVRDLLETAPELDVVIADFDLAAARKLARTFHQGKRLSVVKADARDVEGTARALQGAFAVINTTHHRFNLDAMQAALAAQVHYVDLGGLFHVTRQQAKLDRDFKRIGCTALLGMGAAPGVTNVLARSAADTLDAVEEIHLLVGSVDHTRVKRSHPLASSYTIETIIDEFTQPPAVFTGGEMTFAAPLSGGVDVEFPAPVGAQRPTFTIHSEVLQLSRSYRAKGVQEVTFRIAFEKEWTARLSFLSELGLLAREPVKVGTLEVAPRDVLLALLRQIPPPLTEGPLEQHEVLRAVVVGKRGSRRETHVVDCHCTGVPKWGLGLDVDTGSPPSIAVQLLLRGEITARGALPAERAVPVEPFFAELQKRGMWLDHAIHRGRAAAAIPGLRGGSAAPSRSSPPRTRRSATAPRAR